MTLSNITHIQGHNIIQRQITRLMSRHTLLKSIIHTVLTAHTMRGYSVYADDV